MSNSPEKNGVGPVGFIFFDPRDGSTKDGKTPASEGRRIKAIYEMRDGIAHPGDWKDAPKDPMSIPGFQSFPTFMVRTFLCFFLDLSSCLLIPSLLEKTPEVAGFHPQTFETPWAVAEVCAPAPARRTEEAKIGSDSQPEKS